MDSTVHKVSAIIKEKGFKQCAIAEKAGFSPCEFSNILCGRKTFKAEYVVPICMAIGITPNDLFNITPTGNDQKGA